MLLRKNLINWRQLKDFDNRIKNLNKKATSDKTKHVLVESELDELSEKVKLISSKRLTKYLMNKYRIFNGVKNFLQVKKITRSFSICIC